MNCPNCNVYSDNVLLYNNNEHPTQPNAPIAWLCRNPKCDIVFQIVGAYVKGGYDADKGEYMFTRLM